MGRPGWDLGFLLHMGGGSSVQVGGFKGQLLLSRAGRQGPSCSTSQSGLPSTDGVKASWHVWLLMIATPQGPGTRDWVSIKRKPCPSLRVKGVRVVACIGAGRQTEEVVREYFSVLCLCVWVSEA